MTSGANNFTPMAWDWGHGQAFGAYPPPISDNWVGVYPLFPRPLPFGATPGARSAQDTWLSLPLERVVPELHGLDRNAAAAPPHSHLQIHVLVNDMGREVNPRSRQSVPESPRTQESSKLTQGEQKNALKKLKKEIYNPPPKRMFQGYHLYYRDGNQKRKETDEDGKRCAICLEDFEPREAVMLTPCTHMFHEDCIVPWVSSQSKCPVCRFAI